MACVGRKAYESKTGKTSPATFTDVFYPRHVPGAVFFISAALFSSTAVVVGSLRHSCMHGITTASCSRRDDGHRR